MRFLFLKSAEHKIQKILFIMTTSKYKIAPRAIRECNTLAKQYQLEILEFDCSMTLPTCTREGDVQICRVRPKYWPSFKLLKLLFLLQAMLPVIIRKKPDVIHSFGFVELILGSIGKILHRSKLVYDSYEVYPYQFSQIVRKPLKSLFWYSITAFEDAMLKLCSVVLVVPSYNDELYLRFKRKFRHVFTIWNVPNTQPKYPHASSNNFFRLLYAGSIAEHTGAPVLIKAFSLASKKNSSLMLTLVGQLNRYSNLYNEITRTIQENKNIKLLKAMPHDELEALYQTHDAGLALYPPTYWTYRTKASEKVFEYMSYGLPVIVSDFPGLHEIITETQSGILVNSLDPSSISQAILALANNKACSALIGENGQKAVLTKYNWAICQKTLLEAYRSLER